MISYCSYDPKWSTVENQLNYPSLAEPQKWLNISLKKLNHRNTVGVVFSILYFHHILVRSVPLQYMEQQEVQWKVQFCVGQWQLVIDSSLKPVFVDVQFLYLLSSQ